MSQESIQAIVGMAVLDKQFMHDLLNSKRAQIISRFDLTAEEHRVITGIRAETLEQFAYQLDDWLDGQEPKDFPKSPSYFRYTRYPASL